MITAILLIVAGAFFFGILAAILVTIFALIIWVVSGWVDSWRSRHAD